MIVLITIGVLAVFILVIAKVRHWVQEEGTDDEP